MQQRTIICSSLIYQRILESFVTPIFRLQFWWPILWSPIFWLPFWTHNLASILGPYSGFLSGCPDSGFNSGCPYSGFTSGGPYSGFTSGRPDSGFHSGRPDSGFNSSRLDSSFHCHAYNSGLLTCPSPETIINKLLRKQTSVGLVQFKLRSEEENALSTSAGADEKLSELKGEARRRECELS